jgi:hypothetical protein
VEDCLDDCWVRFGEEGFGEAGQAVTELAGGGDVAGAPRVDQLGELRCGEVG